MLRAVIKRMGISCSLSTEGRTSSNLQQWNFRLCSRKNSLTIWVVKLWDRLPREAVESPEVFKNRLTSGKLITPTISSAFTLVISSTSIAGN